MEAINWIVENHADLAAIVLGLVAVAQVVVRLTPTKKDDGFILRLGGWVDKAMDFLRIPNPKK